MVNKEESVAICIRKGIEHEEQSLKNSHEQLESPVTVREWGSKGKLVISAYYKPSNQVESVNEAFYLQLKEASQLQLYDLLGDFNHLDNCWKSSMGSCR